MSEEVFDGLKVPVQDSNMEGGIATGGNEREH